MIGEGEFLFWGVFIIGFESEFVYAERGLCDMVSLHHHWMRFVRIGCCRRVIVPGSFVFFLFRQWIHYGYTFVGRAWLLSIPEKEARRRTTGA